VADTKLTDLSTPTGGPAVGDWLYSVDISDTTDNVAGSSRKITLQNVLDLFNTIAESCTVTDSVTTTQTTLGTFGHNTSGTPGAAFGGQWVFNLQSTTATNRQAMRFRWYWSTATDASRTAIAVWSMTVSGVDTDFLFFDPTSSGFTAGWLGSGAIWTDRHLRANGDFHAGGQLIGNAARPLTPGGRLTLTSGTPVTTAVVATATTIYYTPYQHDIIMLYDGVFWRAINFTETSLAITATVATSFTVNLTNASTTVTCTSTAALYIGMPITGTNIPTGTYVVSITNSTTFVISQAATNTVNVTGTFYHANYDVFGVFSAFNNNGVLALEALAWSNNTTRATGLTMTNGRLTKTGDQKRLYLGTFRLITSTQTTDSKAQRFLWNMYNRITRVLTKTDSAGGYAYNTATWRAANGNSANKVETLVGLADEPIQLVFNHLITSTTGNTGVAGLSIDLATPAAPYITQCTGGGTTAGWFQAAVIDYREYPGVGYHSFTMYEQGGGSNTTFYGTTNGGCRLFGSVMG